MAALATPRQTHPGSEPNPPEIRILTPGDIRGLRFGWHSRFSGTEMRAVLERYPGRSVWAPQTREYALVGPWRNRDEIAAVLELSAVQHPRTMIGAAVERSRIGGATLALVTELDELRKPSFYERAGFEPLEDVLTYELTIGRGRNRFLGPEPDPRSLTFAPVRAEDEAEIAAMVRIDHAAFPWLWWNSADEFRAYAGTPGVELYLGYQDGEPVAYVGLTAYLGWGHLDRIAVDPARQGGGLGTAALRFATSTLAARGARRIGLSTQAQNPRSRRLYERFGFRRSGGNDYRLYGVWLREPPDGRGQRAEG